MGESDGRIRAMRRWQFWAGVGISLLFLYFALRGLQFGDVWEILEGANYWWLIPGVLIYLVGVIARAWRWHYLLRPIKSIPTTTLFPITAIGYMGNNIYPARAGEVLRALYSGIHNKHYPNTTILNERYPGHGKKMSKGCQWGRAMVEFAP